MPLNQGRKRRFGAMGASKNPYERVSQLAKTLASSDGGGPSAHMEGEGVYGQEVSEFDKVQDPKVQHLQRMHIARIQNQFLKGYAEGRAERDPNDYIGTGPRKDIRDLNRVTRYSGKSTQPLRKSKAIRSFMQGDTEGMVRKYIRLMSKSDPRVIRKLKNIQFDETMVAYQSGLKQIARDTMKTRSKTMGDMLDHTIL